MPLLVAGISHKTAPLALREKVAFRQDELKEALKDLLDSSEDVSEAVIVSTCNRTEIYAFCTTAPRGLSIITAFLIHYCKDLNDQDASLLKDCLYLYEAKACVENLFRVVSSLEALVLGEAQILGQVRQAYLAASACGATGEFTDHLFRQALNVGKLVRTHTTIGTQALSVPTLAIKLCEQICGELCDKTVLVIGAGQMAELTLNYLVEKGVSDVFVANRSVDSAQRLTSKIGAVSIGINELAGVLAHVDICIACASCEIPIITHEMLAHACADSNKGPVVCIDIAIPRNIDPACRDINNVFCYDLDDLKNIIDDHSAQREIEATKACRIVQSEVESFLLWLQEREVTPTIKAIYKKADTICQREVHHTSLEFAKLRGKQLCDDEKALLEALAAAVSKKILHGPVVRMKKQSTNPDAYLYTESARFLFGLDSNPLGLPCLHNVERCIMKRGYECTLAQAGTCPFGKTVQDDKIAS